MPPLATAGRGLGAAMANAGRGLVGALIAVTGGAGCDAGWGGETATAGVTAGTAACRNVVTLARAIPAKVPPGYC